MAAPTDLAAPVGSPGARARRRRRVWLVALPLLVAATQARLTVLGQQRAEGMSTAEWRQAVANVLQDAHLVAAALACGGWDDLDASTLALVGAQLGAQCEYLAAFARDVAAGAAFGARELARLMQYGDGAVRGTASAIQRQDAGAAGATQERNILGSTHPCSECPELSALGWVPLGSLPEVGSRECLGNCHCTIETR